MNAWLESATGLTLASPWLLLAALLAPFALLVRRRRGEPALAFAPASLARGPATPSREARAADAWPSSWRVALLPLPRVLAVVGVLLAAFSLARPVRREPLPLRATGIDIVLAIDTSSSMQTDDAAVDVGPGDAASPAASRRVTRLDAAKDAAAQFVRGRPEDRIGLVAFARFPDVVCPLTLDHDALVAMLSGVGPVPSEGPEDATGIGAAVARAAQALAGDERGSEARAHPRSKVVIVLTDGEENVATAGAKGEIAPTHAAQLCQRLGVRVDAIAVGAGRRSRTGAWERLDTRAVADLARRTGGEFFEARDAAGTRAAYEKIDALEKTAFEAPRYADEDAFLPFLVAAVALLVLARLLESSAAAALP